MQFCSSCPANVDGPSVAVLAGLFIVSSVPCSVIVVSVRDGSSSTPALTDPGDIIFFEVFVAMMSGSRNA